MVIQQIEDQVIEAMKDFKVPVKVLIGKYQMDELAIELQGAWRTRAGAPIPPSEDLILKTKLGTAGGYVFFEKHEDPQALIVVSKRRNEP